MEHDFGSHPELGPTKTCSTLGGDSPRASSSFAASSLPFSLASLSAFSSCFASSLASSLPSSLESCTRGMHKVWLHDHRSDPMLRRICTPESQEKCFLCSAFASDAAAASCEPGDPVPSLASCRAGAKRRELNSSRRVLETRTQCTPNSTSGSPCQLSFGKTDEQLFSSCQKRTPCLRPRRKLRRSLQAWLRVELPAFQRIPETMLRNLWGWIL